MMDATANSVSCGQEVDLTDDSGVKKKVIREGTGDDSPQVGNKVFVHYVGRLLDGTEFDSSRSRDAPFEFELGMNKVIKGWDVGVATMKKGEVCELTCEAKYAYGEQGSPPKIPANATLKFEVELLQWKREDLSLDHDNSIERHTLVKGKGYENPNDGATVTAHIIGLHGDRVFYERDVTYALGEESADHDLPEGVDIALKRFKEGERSKIFIRSNFAFGEDGHTDFKIPPNTEVVYDIELKSFQKAKEAWDLDKAEKLEQAAIYKEKGTKKLQEEKVKMALSLYKKVVEFIKWEEYKGDDEVEQREKRSSLLLAAYLNSALCSLKLKELSDTIENCNSALELDNTSVKALFRRGQAYLGKHEYAKALEDFKRVSEIEPTNTAAKAKITHTEQLIKAEEQKEKQFYRKMFSKMAEANA